MILKENMLNQTHGTGGARHRPWKCAYLLTNEEEKTQRGDSGTNNPFNTHTGIKRKPMYDNEPKVSKFWQKIHQAETASITISSPDQENVGTAFMRYSQCHTT